MLRDDYLIRLIRQFVQVLARIAGFRKRGEYDRAQQAIAHAWEQLGAPRELMLATDAATAASLFRDADQLRVAAALLAEEAHVVHGKGDPLTAAMLRRRAIELLVRARAQAPLATDDEAISELGRYLSPAVLTEALHLERH